MAETLASHHRQRPVVDLVGPGARVDRVAGRERSVWVRLVVAVDTLLGPEKTTTVSQVSQSVGFCGVFLWTIISRTRTALVVGVCWLVVVVVVCLLRIAQWMRASIVCDRL